MGAGAADEPMRGSVRVVSVGPHFFRHAAAGAGMFPGGFPSARRVPSPSPRGALPDFLALGHAGPSRSSKMSIPPAAAARIRDSQHALEAKRKQGMSMWQRVMAKGKHESKESVALLPINAKEMGKQSCTTIPFTQQVTAAGCETVSVPNRLCFGQCSSLFVPSAMDDHDDSVSGRARQCSRCAPSKSRVMTIPLRCGREVRQKRVMVVEECKCETSAGAPWPWSVTGED
ncbi:DAN domain family member 5 [Engraulis encrasicolus]|uniref:DAN domain family member 5 n=1 Tax=Engraulis encrasicolus TaxID=184585 RepID=UPI002FCE8A08